MAQKYLRRPAVEEMTGLSRSTIYLLMSRGEPRGSKHGSVPTPAPAKDRAHTKPAQPDCSMSKNASRRVTAEEAQKIIKQSGLATRMSRGSMKSTSVEDFQAEDLSETSVNGPSRIETLPLDHPERRMLDEARNRNLLVQQARADQQRLERLLGSVGPGVTVQPASSITMRSRIIVLTEPCGSVIPLVTGQ